MTPQERSFTRYLQTWWVEQLQQGRPLGGNVVDWCRGRSADQLAGELRRDLRFHLAQMAFFLAEPDVVASTEIVSALSPPPYGADLRLLVDAIIAAGTTSTKIRRGTLAGAALTAGGMFLNSRVN
ncbi:MAG: hypothetical protein ACREP9_00790 [Candidatus Dormibacteraceae bacterium]